MTKIFDNQLMKEAIKIAHKALASDEVPVGAILVDPSSNNIITKAHNLVETLKNPTAHAEMLIIQNACKTLKNKSLYGLDLYVTLQPCLMCLQAITYAKIRRVYFGTYDPTITLPNLISPNHKIDIYGGICEAECKALLDEFFAKKRSN